MDTDCNALYRYSIRHRVAKWKERGEGKGREQRERDPDRESQTNLIVLIVTFATWSSFVLINLKHMVEKLQHQTIDRFGFIRQQLIRWRSKEEASTSIACSAIDREREGEEKFEPARLADQTFQRRSNILQRLLEPIGRSWLDLGQLSPYPVCRRISLDERRRYNRGWIDKGRSKVEEESRRPEGCLLHGPSSEMGISRGHQLYSLLCPDQKEDTCISP